MNSLINAIEMTLNNEKATDKEKIERIKELVEYAKLQQKENN
jgi:hypothetical protein